LFLEKGCIGCHSLGGQGGKVGPALDGVAKRRDASWIAAHFRNPPTASPGTVMPKFDFTEAQIRALTEFLLTKTEPGVVGFLKLPAVQTPIERGKAVFKKFGCIGCHGRDALGGVPNPNAKTAQQVPGLKFVSEGYTKAELRKRILGGQKEINKLNLKGPKPPLYMPAWGGKVTEAEVADLVEYLMSLLPKEEKTEF
jgi:mono/diheme cytochrome c family protein